MSSKTLAENLVKDLAKAGLLNGPKPVSDWVECIHTSLNMRLGILPAPLPVPPEPSKPEALQRQVGGSHYKAPIQHAEYCQRNGISWCEASAIKYLVRHRLKNKLQDVLKALHYVIILLDLEYDGWRNSKEAEPVLLAINPPKAVPPAAPTT